MTRALHYLSAATIALGALAATAAPAARADGLAPASEAAAQAAAFEARLKELKLPSFEGLTPQSDFGVYTAEGVPEDIQRAAYKKAYELMGPIWAARTGEQYDSF